MLVATVKNFKTLGYLCIALLCAYGTFSQLYVAVGVFVFLTPLFLSLHHAKSKGIAILIIISFLYLWGLAACWWLNLSFMGMAFFGAVSYLFYAPALYCFFYFKNHPFLRGFLLVLCWLLAEYYHLHGEASFAYMPIGNVLGKLPFLVQWYEITGVLGGSFWILLFNLGLYRVFIHKKTQKSALALVAIAVIPFLISRGIYHYRYTTINEIASIKTAAIELNFNPEEDAFEIMVNKLLTATHEVKEQKPQLILWPECGDLFWGKLEELQQSVMTDTLIDLQLDPETQLVFFGVGLDDPQQGPTFNDVTFGISKFNVSSLIMAFQNDSIHYWRSKQKYVIGEEYMPNTPVYQVIKHIIPQRSNYYSSKYPQEKKWVNYQTKTASSLLVPLLCYEMLYGDFVSQQVNNTGNLIVGLQNEYWIRNSHQSQQTLNYTALRCIENRKELVKVSNKGINAHINTFGEIQEATEEALLVNAKTNAINTYYSKLGDERIVILLLLLWGTVLLVNHYLK